MNSSHDKYDCLINRAKYAQKRADYAPGIVQVNLK